MSEELDSFRYESLSPRALEEIRLGALTSAGLSNGVSSLAEISAVVFEWRTRGASRRPNRKAYTNALRKLDTKKEECLFEWEGSPLFMYFSNTDVPGRVRSYKGADSIKRAIEHEVWEREYSHGGDGERTFFCGGAILRRGDLAKLKEIAFSGKILYFGGPELVDENWIVDLGERLQNQLISFDNGSPRPLYTDFLGSQFYRQSGLLCSFDMIDHGELYSEVVFTFPSEEKSRFQRVWENAKPSEARKPLP